SWGQAWGLDDMQQADNSISIGLQGSYFAQFDRPGFVSSRLYDGSASIVPVPEPGALLVTTTNDSGPGSLRQVLLDAKALPGDNTIQILVNGTIPLASPLPLITGNTLIERTGTNVIISGEGRVGIFSIASGTANTFRGLTIANGWLTNTAN